MRLTQNIFSLIIVINLFCIGSVFADNIIDPPENMDEENYSTTSNDDDFQDEDFNFILDDTDEEAKNETLYTNKIKVKAGYSNTDSFKYGEYTGVENEGFFPDADVSILLRDDYDGNNTNYLKFSGENLGLESRSISAEYGEQGKYSLSFLHDQLQHYIYDDAVTPFKETNENNLTLPNNWSGGVFTDEMTSLMTSLNELEIETHRKKDGGEVLWLINKNWKITSDYYHEHKDGTNLTGAAFGTNPGNPRGVVIPVELDQNRDEMDIALSYEGVKSQAKISYNLSIFSNKQKSLIWKNPFLNPSSRNPWDESVDFIAGGEGQLGLDPDNQAHQFLLSGGYDLWARTRVSGIFSYGRMIQNDDYLPYTVNPNLAVPIPLPEDDLDGKINTWHAGFVFSSRPYKKLNFKLKYTFNDRDNDTAKNTYVFVPNDSGAQSDPISQDARVNRPYSNQQHKIEFNTIYQILSKTKLAVGYGLDLKNRTYSEVDKNIEHTARIKLSTRPFVFTTAWLEYEHRIRNGSSYNSNEPYLETLTPAYKSTLPLEDQFDEDPLMRKFYIADRKQDKLKGSISFMPFNQLLIGLNSSITIDDYNNSDLGLKDFRSFNISLDPSYTLKDNLIIYGLIAFDNFAFEQTGYNHSEQSEPLPPKAMRDPEKFWDVDNKDSITSFGFGIDWQPIKEKLDLTFDYEYSKAITNTAVRGGDSLEFIPVPDQKTRIHSFKLNVAYHFAKNLTFNFGYNFEEYKATDFAQDNIEPNTNGFVITSGESTQDYSAHTGQIGLTYKF